MYGGGGGGETSTSTFPAEKLEKCQTESSDGKIWQKDTHWGKLWKKRRMSEQNKLKATKNSFKNLSKSGTFFSNMAFDTIR